MQKYAKDYGLLQHRKNIGVFGWHKSEVLTAGLRYKISSPAYCYSHSEASFTQHMDLGHLQLPLHARTVDPIKLSDWK